jgi:sulfur relay (sulfurtransferase) DsrC/TusE family protein
MIMKEEHDMSVLDNFQDWKSFLAQRVAQAATVGMEKETMENVAYQIGNYLSNQVDPKNEQERLLKELWDAGTEEQRHAMAGAMINYVQNKKQ